MYKVLALILICLSLVSFFQCKLQTGTGGDCKHQTRPPGIWNRAIPFSTRAHMKRPLPNIPLLLALIPGWRRHTGRVGRTYFFAGKGLSAAVDDYTRAIELDAAYTKAYYYRGLANAANGGYERAAADFTKTIELDKTISRAFHLRAWCNSYKAQWDQSSQLYLYQLFESDAGLMEAYKGQGWVYVRQPLWQYFAEPDLIKVAEQDPPVSEVYVDRGFVHFKKAQWAQAVSDLEKVYAIDHGLNQECLE